MIGRISDAALASGVASALRLDSRMIASIDRQPASYRSSSELEELDVQLMDGSALSLIFKDCGSYPARRSSESRPDFLFEPMRSIAIYRSLLSDGWDGTTFRGAVVQPGLKRYWLFLERVDGSPLDEIGDWSIWQAAAGWLGAFHTAMAPTAADPPSSVPFLRYDAKFLRTWMRRALSFAQDWPTARRQRLERLADHHEMVVERLSAERATVIHGDFHASNVLVTDLGAGTICPVDWELAGIGPGLLDLAALASGNVSEAERRLLVDAYRSSMTLLGATAPSVMDMTETLDCGLFHLAIQWMGWHKHWQPPADQARDWLADAELQAGKL